MWRVSCDRALSLQLHFFGFKHSMWHPHVNISSADALTQKDKFCDTQVIMISHVISLALFVFIGVFGLGTYGQDVEVGNQKFGRKWCSTPQLQAGVFGKCRKVLENVGNAFLLIPEFSLVFGVAGSAKKNRNQNMCGYLLWALHWR